MNKDEGGRKKESDFSVLFRTLIDAPSIATYISQQHNNDLRNIKSMNNFLQSISQRPNQLYDELMANHKAEVAIVLERLLECLQGRSTTATSSGGAAPTGSHSSTSQTMTPAAHEWVIRCRQGGVGRKAWEVDVTPLPDAVQGTMSTRQILKALIAFDNKGHLTRIVELATNADRLLDAISTLANDDTASNNEKIVVLTRLLSKARGLLDGTEEDEDEKPKKADTKDVTRKPKAERRAQKLRETQGLQEKISEEQSKEIVKQLLDLSYDIFVRGKAAATGKYTKFAEWAIKKSLVSEDYKQVIERIEAESQQALLGQANNLELLLNLKSGDVTQEEFVKVLDSLTDAEKNCFTTNGVDVLSAIAVTANKFAESRDLMDSIVDRFVNTHKEAQGTLQLPRRVMTFIAAQRQKKEQSQVNEFRKKREREDAEKFGTHGNPNKGGRKVEKAPLEYVEEEL